MYSTLPSAIKNSPVVISKNATPPFSFSTYIAAKKLLFLCSSNLSLVAMPGVSISVTPRFTIPLTVLGSSN